MGDMFLIGIVVGLFIAGILAIICRLKLDILIKKFE